MEYASAAIDASMQSGIDQQWVRAWHTLPGRGMLCVA